jgi:DNA-binding XRE family transcriptional regulator
MSGHGCSSFALGVIAKSTYHNAKPIYRKMAIDKEFESKLMRLRSLRRMTQEELAATLGVTRTTIMNWETGRAVPRLTVRQFKALLKTLNITVDELPDDFGPQRIYENN